MAENPPETPNYGFPIMSEADDDYVDVWHLVMEDGGPTENDGFIVPIDAILDGIEDDVASNSSNISSVESDLSAHESSTSEHGANGDVAGTNDLYTDSEAAEAAPVQSVDGETGHVEIDAGVPSGVITMWSGSISEVPDGWELCDGNNGTPDLRNRFIVGAGDSYSVNDTGGVSTVQLSNSEMPSHIHKYITLDDDGGSGNTGPVAPVSSGRDSNVLEWDTSSSGGNEAHENRPPYFALAYIMKA